MNREVLKSKLPLHLLLLVLTVACVFVSYNLYGNDLASRTLPQIKQAMVEVSKLLPELEENEQAIRDAYNGLENSRRVVYQNNEEALEQHRYNGVDADTIIDRTLSWKNLVTMLKVGQRGHVIVISQDDFTILAHPDSQFVGEKLYPLGKVDMSAIPDISEVEQVDIDKFTAFFPSSFFQSKVGLSRFYDAADAGVYGMAFAYKDTYILCGATLYEAISSVLVRTLLTTFAFLLAASILVRYVGYLLGWQRDGLVEFRGKLVTYCVPAVAVLFGFILYYQTLTNVTGEISAMNYQAQVAAENVGTYQQYSKELSAWLDDQYLEQCRLAKELVQNVGKANITRADLAEFAKELRVKYIYVYDKDGKVVVTNSPYDHLQVSTDPQDQSYAFRPLLEGREYVVQEAQADAITGTKMQYIGVSLRDENDLADGFVQIAIDPALRDRLLAPISLQTVLEDLVIGLSKYALAIDKDTLKIVSTTGLGFENMNVTDLGIAESELKENFTGLVYIKGEPYYAGVSESDELYLMPLASASDDVSAFTIALEMTAFNAAALFVLSLMALSIYKKALSVEDAEGETEVGAGKNAGTLEDDDGATSFSGLADMVGVRRKFGFDDRWSRFDDVPFSDRPPEARIRTVIYYVLLTVATLLVVFETVMIFMGMTRQLTGFAYVLMGSWEKGINLFSLSYCLFLMCVLYMIQEILNQGLYHLAKTSSLKGETILILLRSVLKYACALIFLYIGLAKFGIDTKTLWASAGVLSLMVGFGAKDLVGDVIAGLFIIFEGTYRIGDFITVGNWFGTVQEIGIRYTKIKYFSDTKIINNSAIRDIVNNEGEGAAEAMRIAVPEGKDPAEVKSLIEKQLPELAKNIAGLIKLMKHECYISYEDGSVLLKVSVFCDPDLGREALRAMRHEIVRLFEREQIGIGRDQITIIGYMDGEGSYSLLQDDWDPEDDEAAEEERPE